MSGSGRDGPSDGGRETNRDGDPLTDFTDVGRIRRVVRAGIVREPAALLAENV